MPYVYEYPRPMVTVDAVVFAVRVGVAEVLLIRRKHAPYAGAWALPGGFVDMEETIEAAAARELEEETGLKGLPLRQFHAFGAPDRDPRGRSIGVGYWTVADARQVRPEAGDDAADVAWHPVCALPTLAFDHALIMAYAWVEFVDALRGIGVDAAALPASLSAGRLRRLRAALGEGVPLVPNTKPRGKRGRS